MLNRIFENSSVPDEMLSADSEERELLNEDFDDISRFANLYYDKELSDEEIKELEKEFDALSVKTEQENSFVNEENNNKQIGNNMSLFNEAEFDSLFEKKMDVVDKKQDIASDLDDMFASLFEGTDANPEGDPEHVKGGEDDPGKGGSIDPNGDDKGNPPAEMAGDEMKFDFEALFEAAPDTDDDANVDPAKKDEKKACPNCGKETCECDAKKSGKKKGGKLKSDFEALFETDKTDPENGEDDSKKNPAPAVDPEAPVDPSEEDDDSQIDEVASECALMTDFAGLDL